MPEAGKATIYSVAERAQVSIATVSRVLSGANRVSSGSRDRVLAAVRELDYIPDRAARSLVAKRHQALGLVLPELGGYYYPELLTGFESLAAERRMSVILTVVAAGSDVEASLAELCSRVDAVAVMDGAGTLAPVQLRALSRRTPLVVIGGAPDRPAAITTSSRENARLLTAHLLDHGRTRPIFAGSPELAADAAARWQGFQDALRERGLRVPPPQPSGFDAAEGAQIGGRIASGELDCDAVVCVNDEVALGLCLALRRHGLSVGEQIAVTGWDDAPATRYTTPGITTVAQPVRELGRAAAVRLLDLIDGRTAETPLELSTRIVLRGSCGCPDTPPWAIGPGGPTKESS